MEKALYALHMCCPNPPFHRIAVRLTSDSFYCSRRASQLSTRMNIVEANGGDAAPGRKQPPQVLVALLMCTDVSGTHHFFASFLSFVIDYNTACGISRIDPQTAQLTCSR